jgi:hypothetical protein
MVQAAATGVVDFSTAAPDDRWWWKRLSWVLDHLETENRLRVLGARHSALCAALAAGPDADTVNRLVDKVDQLTGALSDALLPWEKGEAQAGLNRSVTKLATAWDTIHGNRNDPAVAERIRRTVAAIHRGTWDEEQT